MAYIRSMRTGLFICLLLYKCLASFGQQKATADALQHDRYKITSWDGNHSIELLLDHMPYADEGRFENRDTHHDATLIVQGDWTVLRGDAVNRDATVVALYYDGGHRKEYFLRRKDGDLQQLDSALRQIKPIKNYIFRKQ